MSIDIYSSVFMQFLMFALLAAVLLTSVISLFIKPAKRIIRASLVNAANGKIIDISRSETSIGRARTCDVVINDMTVSRFHAVLSKRSNEWLIFDTHSTSGTKVNGKIIQEKATLKDGDYIKFGVVEYVFYSTAVTTRQQLVPKTRKQPASNQRNGYTSSANQNRNQQRNTNRNNSNNQNRNTYHANYRNKPTR